MVKRVSRFGAQAGRWVAIATVTGLLSACGSSSGDDDAVDGSDFDNDGLIDSEDDDADGDGVLDIDDNFIDLDSDGFDDVTGLTQAEADELDEDEDGFVEVSEENPCGSEEGSDNSSATAAWNDNCYIERSLTGGQFADSLFSVGIQRVVYCLGYANETTYPDYTDFADGEYGPASEEAVIAFQNAESLTPDGVVGEFTWGRLQDRLELLTLGVAGEAPDVFGFSTGSCAGIPLFYQTVSEANEPLGWMLARDQPNEAEMIPFSYEEPFGRR